MIDFKDYSIVLDTRLLFAFWLLGSLRHLGFFGSFLLLLASVLGCIRIIRDPLDGGLTVRLLIFQYLLVGGFVEVGDKAFFDIVGGALMTEIFCQMAVNARRIVAESMEGYNKQQGQRDECDSDQPPAPRSAPGGA